MKSKIFTIIIALVLLISPFCAKSTLAASASEATDGWNNDVISFTAPELLRMRYDEEISDEELIFLAPLGTIVSYSGTEGAEIEAEVDGTSRLTVTAPVFHTGELSYVPQYAIVGENGEKRSDEYDDGKFVIEGVENESSLTVHYKATATVPSETMNEIANSAYETALGYKEAFEALMKQYDEQYADYEAKHKTYIDYLEAKARYDEAFSAYQDAMAKYNRDLALWNDRNEAYEDYLDALEEYKKEYAEYEQYQSDLKAYNEKLSLYNKYLADYEAYEKQMKEYEATMSSTEMQKIRYQLDILDYITRPVTDMERTLYGAITGGAVDTVLKNKELLIATGGKNTSGAINLAETATLALRALFEQLMTKTTDETRYQFYISSHDSLAENFISLLQTLDNLYNLPDVRKKMKEMDKVPQYEVLLAQLYYISMALEDVTIFDYEFEYGDWKKGQIYTDTYAFYGGRKPSDILKPEDRLTLYKDEDKWGTPLSDGYHAVPEMPKEPEPVDNPGSAPTAKTMPVKPKEVEPNGDKPTEPQMTLTEPEVVYDVTPPVKPIQDPTEAKLVEALESGAFHSRERIEEDLEFTIEREKTIYFRTTYVDLTFYDADGKVICTIHAERGQKVPSPPEPPEKTEDGYTYTFDGWVTAEGEFINLNRLVTKEQSTLALYPHYVKSTNMYEITFVIDGREVKKSFEFGSTPVYNEATDGELKKEGDRLYRFTGWETEDGKPVVGEFPSVVGDATYVAQFEESLIVTFDIEGVLTQRFVWSGETAFYDGKTPVKAADNKYMYTFSHWDKPFEPIFVDTVYRAIFAATPIFEFGGEPVEIVETDRGLQVSLPMSGEKVDFGTLLNMALERSMAMRFVFEPTERSLGAHVLEFSLSTIADLCDAGASTMKFDVRTEGNSLFVSLRFDKGDASIKATLCGEFDRVNTYMYEKNGTNRTETRFTFTEDGEINFTLRSGCEYEIRAEYALSVLSSEYVSVSVECERAPIGDEIVVKVGELPLGMFLAELFYTTDSGEKVVIEGNKFVMPSSSVKIGVKCDFYLYTIVFKSEGKVLVTRTLRYGETVVPPDPPTKPSDEQFAYTFKGWDKEVTKVTGDAEYNAMFAKTDLPPVDIGVSRFVILYRVMIVVLPIFVIIVALTVALIVLYKKGILRIWKQKIADRIAAKKAEKAAALAAAEAERIAEEERLAAKKAALAKSKNTKQYSAKKQNGSNNNANNNSKSNNSPTAKNNSNGKVKLVKNSGKASFKIVKKPKGKK